MKAIRVSNFGEPDVLKWEDVADPQPRAGQVLVTIKAAGVNPVETYIRAGKYAKLPQLPYTPGTGAGGIIEAVGSGVEQLKVGQRVYVANSLTGTYAEKAVCDASQVHLLPEVYSFEQGAAINVPYVTAYRALYCRAEAQAGQTVLVHGATGGVGLAAVQFAVAAGLIVIGTGGTEEGRTLVREQGAAFVLDHKKPNYLDELKQFTNGRGVDIVLEMLANVNLGKDLTLLARHGTVVVIGSRGDVTITPRELMRTEGRIIGLLGGNEFEAQQAHAAIGAGLRSSTLNPIIGQKFSMPDAAKAHDAILSSSAQGKIVLIP